MANGCRPFQNHSENRDGDYENVHSSPNSRLGIERASKRHSEQYEQDYVKSSVRTEVFRHRNEFLRIMTVPDVPDDGNEQSQKENGIHVPYREFGKESRSHRKRGLRNSQSGQLGNHGNHEREGKKPDRECHERSDAAEYASGFFEHVPECHYEDDGDFDVYSVVVSELDEFSVRDESEIHRPGRYVRKEKREEFRPRHRSLEILVGGPRVLSEGQSYDRVNRDWQEQYEHEREYESRNLGNAFFSPKMENGNRSDERNRVKEG